MSVIAPAAAENNAKNLEWLVQDTESLRGFLYWMSHHSELNPLASVLFHFATTRVMHAWLGDATCQRCEHYLGLLGLDFHSPAVSEICKCAASVAYREALKNPLQTIQMAEKSVAIISQAMDRLAHMPEAAEAQHNQLADAILETDTNKSKPSDLLQKGIKIYGKATGMGEWLHLGLPEILSEIKQGSLATKQKLQEYIRDVYQKWRLFGVEHHERVKEEVEDVAERLKSNKRELSNDKGKEEPKPRITRIAMMNSHSQWRPHFH